MNTKHVSTILILVRYAIQINPGASPPSSTRRRFAPAWSSNSPGLGSISLGTYSAIPLRGKSHRTWLERRNLFPLIAGAKGKKVPKTQTPEDPSDQERSSSMFSFKFLPVAVRVRAGNCFHSTTDYTYFQTLNLYLFSLGAEFYLTNVYHQ